MYPNPICNVQIKDALIGHVRQKAASNFDAKEWITFSHKSPLVANLCKTLRLPTVREGGGFFLQRQGAAKAACYHNS